MKAQRPSLATIGLLLAGAGGPVSYALGQGAFSTGDEPMHVDYAYQIWHGRLPTFYGGMMLHNVDGYHSGWGVQWTSQHPPLFYLLLAPIIGPITDAGHQNAAVMAARVVMVAMAVATVFATRWTVKSIFPHHPRVPILAALLVALSSWFPRQGGSVYNDMPAVLATVLALGFASRLLRDGGRRNLVGLCVSLAAASLVRFATIPVAAVILGGLLVARLVIDRRGIRSFVEPVAGGLSILVASGWWWYRNYRDSGNIQGAHMDFVKLHKASYQRHSFGDIVWHSDFWKYAMQQYGDSRFMRGSPVWLERSVWAIYVLLLAPLALGAVAVLIHLVRARRAGRDTAVTAMLALTTAGCAGIIVLAQIYYTMSGGSMFGRYIFAAICFFAAFMAFGFGASRVGLLLFYCWLVIRVPAFAVEVWSIIHRHVSLPAAPIWPTWSWAAYGVAVLGALVVAVALIRVPINSARQAEPRAPGGRRLAASRR